MAEEPGEIPEEPRTWSQVWQLPLLCAGFVLLVVGAWLGPSLSDANDFTGVLDRAQEFLAQHQFEDANRELDVVRGHLPEVARSAQARYWLLRADWIFLEQRAKRLDLDAHHQKVLQCYNQAEDLGGVLGPDRLERFAQTLVALDRIDDTLAFVERLADQPPRQRYGLVKWIIEDRGAQSDLSPKALMRLLEYFDGVLREEVDARVRRLESIWSVSLRARASIGNDDPRGAIELLARSIQQFAGGGSDEDLAELHLLLARAHQQTGEFEDARWYYLKTQKMVDAADVLAAAVLVGLGRLDLAVADNVGRALKRFRRVTEDFPNAPVLVHALLGQGDCEAKLGLHAAAIGHLGRAAEELVAVGDDRDPRRRELSRIVLSHFSLHFDKSEFEWSLNYLTVLVPLWAHGLPADLLDRFAWTHERLAQQYLDGVSRDHASRPTQAETEFQEAAIHFSKAACYYLDYAAAVADKDAEAQGRSLWQSAECYEKAQLWQSAIEVYSQFVQTRASDSRYLNAVYRLGLALLADRQYEAAVGRFRYLIERDSQSPMACESLVPLARCHVALGRLDAAKHILNGVVDNQVSISPDSQVYRDALIELAQLHYRRQEFSEAIHRFTILVDRLVTSPSPPVVPGDLPRSVGPTTGGRSVDPRDLAATGDPAAQGGLGPSIASAGALLFYLGDSYRRSAAQQDAKLKEMLSKSVRQRIQQERIEKLKQAQEIYGQVIARLDGRPDELSTVGRHNLRNAHFYQADCAYKLGQWKKAIVLYDAVAKRWDRHPASIAALVQIVNAHAEQGKFKEARIANDRARFHLERISDQAFEDETLPVTQQHWQDWLKWEGQLDLPDAQAKAGSGP